MDSRNKEMLNLFNYTNGVRKGNRYKYAKGIVIVNRIPTKSINIVKNRVGLTTSMSVDSIDSIQNYVDGKFSTLLASVPCRGGFFGDFVTYSVIAPFFKRLNTGYISNSL